MGAGWNGIIFDVTADKPGLQGHGIPLSHARPNFGISAYVRIIVSRRANEKRLA